MGFVLGPAVGIDAWGGRARRRPGVDAGDPHAAVARRPADDRAARRGNRRGRCARGARGRPARAAAALEPSGGGRTRDRGGRARQCGEQPSRAARMVRSHNRLASAPMGSSTAATLTPSSRDRSLRGRADRGRLTGDDSCGPGSDEARPEGRLGGPSCLLSPRPSGGPPFGRGSWCRGSWRSDPVRWSRPSAEIQPTPPPPSGPPVPSQETVKNPGSRQTSRSTPTRCGSTRGCRGGPLGARARWRRSRRTRRRAPRSRAAAPARARTGRCPGRPARAPAPTRTPRR